MYYKLGVDKLKEYTETAGRSWAEFGARSPVKRRLVLLGTSVTLIVVLLLQLGQSYNPNEVMRGLLPDGTTGLTGTKA
jgi:hypothetical protein